MIIAKDEEEEEMNCAILTFHGADNYGSVLQAYALMKSIRANCDCEIINYIPAHQKELYAVYLPANNIKNIVKNTRAFMFRKMLEDRKNRFSDFRRTILEIIDGEEIEDSKRLNEYLNTFDAVVCGSDQIWNPKSIDFSEEFFLPKYKGRKIAYAPSFGNAKVADFGNRAEYISSKIKDFDYISIRESSGLDMLRNLGVKNDVTVVLDPTLLLTAKQWDALTLHEEDNNRVEEKYIFFYSIDYNQEAIDMVERISHLSGLPVKIIFSTNKTYKAIHKFHLVKETSPLDFLKLIKNSELVLSTSFHGVAFSTIYRKKFYALESKRGNDWYCDERIHSLLLKYKLNDRILRKPDVEKLDWNRIRDIHYDENLIKECISNSKRYIEMALRG